MAGTFELFTDRQSHVRFRLLAPDGTVLAHSRVFGDKDAAAAAITDVRECAGTGLIQDHCATAHCAHPSQPEVAETLIPWQPDRSIFVVIPLRNVVEFRFNV
ncbi:YegP family protein [Pseudarthrobacter sp. B907]|uniref:YegP family protein n=1 Tax=Pseudarthrobacter sp. B907 TaxID=3158261 RepID=UPI0032DAD489